MRDERIYEINQDVFQSRKLALITKVLQSMHDRRDLDSDSYRAPAEIADQNKTFNGVNRLGMHTIYTMYLRNDFEVN